MLSSDAIHASLLGGAQRQEIRHGPVAAKRKHLRGVTYRRRRGDDRRRRSEMAEAAIGHSGRDRVSASSLRETTPWRSRTGLMIGVGGNPLDQTHAPPRFAKAAFEAPTDRLAPGTP